MQVIIEVETGPCECLVETRHENNCPHNKIRGEQPILITRASYELLAAVSELKNVTPEHIVQTLLNEYLGKIYEELLK